jgi:hypothetical protein
MGIIKEATHASLGQRSKLRWLDPATASLRSPTDPVQMLR